MSEWIEYTGSDEQLAMLLTMHDKFMVDSKLSILNKPTCLKLAGNQTNIDWLKKHFFRNNVTRFLICKPHPSADLIKIWADTGCPVWVRHEKYNQLTGGVTYPSYCMSIVDWNMSGAEYSLTPFKDQ